MNAQSHPDHCMRAVFFLHSVQDFQTSLPSDPAFAGSRRIGGNERAEVGA